MVVINNVVQKPTTNFTVSGTTLTIVGTAVASGDVIYATHIGGALPIGQAASLDLNGASDQLILDADGDSTISADTDDQIDFKAGGTDVMSMTATGLTINDGTTITVADNTDNLTLTSTDADANAGPNLRLYRNSSSPADDDLGGVIEFEGRNDNSQDVVYTRIETFQSDVSDGTEDAAFTIETMLNGTLRERMGMGIVATVFNDDSQDIDFRVESNHLANAIRVNAGINLGGITGHGAVGIGVDPGVFFDCSGDLNNDVVARFDNSDDASGGGFPYGIQIRFTGTAPDNTTSYFFNCSDTSTDRFRIESDGDAQNHDNSYGSISDERIKQDIRDSNSQWDDIKAIKVRNYKKKDDVRQYGDKAWEQIGVIAQELEAAGMDKLVKESDPTPSDIKSDSSFGTLYEDGDTIPEGKEIGDVKEVKEQVKGVSYSVLYMKAIKALQEAMAKIETLETKVKALEDA